jgi:hypothetical protein
MLAYDFELMAVEGENLVLEPTAGLLLFSPPRVSLVGANNCVDTAVELHAEKGRLVEGQVIPPSTGIKVTVTKGSSDEVVVVTETAEDGKFKIGPLQGGVDYRFESCLELELHILIVVLFLHSEHRESGVGHEVVCSGI